PELLASALFASCAGGPRPLHSSPTRRSSDLTCRAAALGAPTRRAAAPLVGGAPVRCRRSGPAPPSPRRALLAGLVEELLQLLGRSEEHTSELQSRENLVCRLLLEKKKTKEQI